MKKIFTKLIGVTLGLAMAVGVGVGVAANNRAATKLSAEDSTYQKVTSLSAGKQVLIVSHDTGGQYYFMDAVTGATSAGPKYITCSLSNGNIVGEHDDHLFTVSASSTNWKFATGSKYLKWSGTSSNTAVRINTGDSNNTWTYSNGTLKFSSATRYLGVYTDGTDWRSYNSATAANYSGTGSNIEFYEKVSSRALSSITLSGTYPTTFAQNDDFSHDGIVVTAHYDDSTTADVTSSATFSGYNMATIGNQTVTVSYEENEVAKTATYSITINEAVPEPSVETRSLYEFINGENTDTVAYSVTAKIKAFKSGDTKDKYGNMTLTDDTNDLVIYGATMTASALRWNKVDKYVFTNPQNFMTNEESNALVIGQSITMKLIRCDYENKEHVIITEGQGVITNIAGIPATAISLNESTAEVEVGSILELTATLTPSNSTDSYTWESSSDAIATVSNGVVTGVAVGEAIITAKVSDDIKATCTVTVVAATCLDETIVLNYSGVASGGNQVTDGEALEVVGCGNSHVQAVSVTKIYKGNGSGGAYPSTGGFLKTGTSSLAGQIVLSLDGLANRVSILCHDFTKKTDPEASSPDTISVNGSSEKPAPYNEDAEFETVLFELNQASKTITIDVTKRIYIKEIRITYIVLNDYFNNATPVATIHGDETGSGVENVYVRFGVSIPKSDLDAIASKCVISEYGVMLFKRKAAGSAYMSTSTPVKDAFFDDLSLTVISRKSSVLPTPTDGSYTFTAQVNYKDPTKYGNEICAASFFVIDGAYYFLCEKQESAKSLASFYLNGTNTTGLSDDALQAIIDA